MRTADPNAVWIGICDLLRPWVLPPVDFPITLGLALDVPESEESDIANISPLFVGRSAC